MLGQAFGEGDVRPAGKVVRADEALSCRVELAGRADAARAIAGPTIIDMRRAATRCARSHHPAPARRRCRWIGRANRAVGVADAELHGRCRRGRFRGKARALVRESGIGEIGNRKVGSRGSTSEPCHRERSGRRPRSRGSQRSDNGLPSTGSATALRLRAFARDTRSRLGPMNSIRSYPHDSARFVRVAHRCRVDCAHCSCASRRT